MGAIGAAGNPLSSVTERLGEVGGIVGKIDQRLAAIRAERSALDRAAVDLNHVTATLAEFDGLWDVLIPAERSRLVQLLVERVVCSAESNIQVVFRAAEHWKLRAPRSPDSEIAR